ncbi:hypothetical protein VTI28DRAFT_3829 [Corynascus sepedonium]
MSLLSNNAANVATKRPSNEPGFQIRRSKRSKYSVIACEECRNRKLKCLRSQENRACDRCIRDGIHCMTRRHRGIGIGIEQDDVVDARTRLEKVEEELSLLRGQLAHLSSDQHLIQCPDQGIREPSQPLAINNTRFVTSEVHGRVEPHFTGTTHPAFSLNIAETSLARLGVTAHHEDIHQPSAGLSSSQYSEEIQSTGQGLIRNDPLLLLPLREVERLFTVFQDEIQTVYPILHSLEFESRIPGLYERIRLQASGRFRGTPEQKELQLLKVVLATALVLEEPGRPKLGLELVSSVEDDVGKIAAHPHVDLMEIRIIIVMAIYHFLSDEELYAWRTIGIAARLALEMGLHRRQSLLENFPDPKERTIALCLFWCIYVLDRQWSLGTGLSFALVERDIDPELPEIPLDLLYLRCLVGYGRLCTKVWEALPQFGTTPGAIPPGTATLLDAQISNWFGGIPAEFRISSPFNIPPGLRHSTSRGVRSARTLMYLRANHLRSLVNRQYVLSTTAIAANLQQARLVVHIARDSIQVLVALSRESDVYARQQAAYNHFLVSALSIVLLATSHAPALFAHICRKDFSDAIDLVKGFSQTSVAGRRLWKSMRGLVSAVSRLVLGGSKKDTTDERLNDSFFPSTLPGLQSTQNQVQNEKQGQVHTDILGPNPNHHTTVPLQPEFLGSEYRNLNSQEAEEHLDPNIYSTQGRPNMAYMGSDLMGLFDTFSHDDGIILHEGDNSLSLLHDSSTVTLGDGAKIDQISQFFMGLI